MIIKTKIEKIWGKIRNDRNGVVVEFQYPKYEDKYVMESIPTMLGRRFKWVPTYKDLEEIKLKLDEVEKMNAEENLAKKPYNF